MVIHVETLSLDMAKTMATAAEKKARELNLKLAVSIMDAHGNLKFYFRMDGNNFISVRMSQLKAMTSASVPISTKQLAEKNASLTTGTYLNVPEMVMLEGGLPIITKNGEHIGSIGISGATPELDGVCAQAALDSIQDEL